MNDIVTHDPLCPQQPRADGATLEMRNGKVVYCGCDLIAEVIAAAVQRVAALAEYVLRDTCIAAIKGEQND